MDITKRLNINNFSQNFENVIIKIFKSIDLSDINDSTNSNVVINKILENPKDEVLFNETVEFLKKHKEIKEKEISLSDNNLLTISIE